MVIAELILTLEYGTALLIAVVVAIILASALLIPYLIEEIGRDRKTFGGGIFLLGVLGPLVGRTATTRIF